MKIKFFVWIILSFLISCHSNTEEKHTPANSVHTAGIGPCHTAQTAGLILPKVDSLRHAENYCCILSPQEGFTVYDSPNGKSIGTLKREINTYDDQSPYKIYIFSDTTKHLVDAASYREIGYDLFAINYTAMVDGYVHILESNKHIWLKIDELEKKGFMPIDWMTYLLQERNVVMGYYANKPGLQLRKEPKSTSELIRTISGDLFEIKLTKHVSGPWHKVLITKHKEHPCQTDLNERENTMYKTEGWIKIVDDDGEPTIWSYLKGC